jgi:hypothetical protein
MVFKGRDPLRSKILINNNIVEQINTFSCLGCCIAHQNEKDVAVKISKSLQVMGNINRTLKLFQAQNHTRLRICNTLT